MSKDNSTSGEGASVECDELYNIAMYGDRGNSAGLLKEIRAEVTRLATQPATAGAPVDAPFLKIIDPGHGMTQEVWLMAVDAQGAFTPYRDTGPLRIPADWQKALATPIHKGA